MKELDRESSPEMCLGVPSSLWLSRMTFQEAGRGTMAKERRVTEELLAEIFPPSQRTGNHSIYQKRWRNLVQYHKGPRRDIA